MYGGYSGAPVGCVVVQTSVVSSGAVIESVKGR